MHSISFDVPDQLIPVFPAYEERFLCLVLSLLRAPRSRVIYVTSQPIHPRVVDYYFSLVPELDTPEARSRFETVSLVDGRNEPLSRKLLARPGAIAADQAAHRRARGGDDHPLLHDGRGGRSRRGAAAPDLRMRPGPRLAGVEDGEPAGVRRGGRPTPGRARRAVDGRSRARAGRAAGAQPARPRGGPQARSRRQRPRERVARPRRGVTRPARGDRARGRGDRRRAVPRALLDEQGGIVEERIGGRGLPEPERPAAHEPCGAGRHHVDARPGTRRRERPDVLRLPLPGRSGLRGADRGRGAQGRAQPGARGRDRPRRGRLRDGRGGRARGSLTRSRSTSAAAARRIRCSRSRASRTASTTRSPGSGGRATATSSTTPRPTTSTRRRTSR